MYYVFVSLSYSPSRFRLRQLVCVYLTFQKCHRLTDWLIGWGCFACIEERTTTREIFREPLESNARLLNHLLRVIIAQWVNNDSKLINAGSVFFMRKQNNSLFCANLTKFSNLVFIWVKNHKNLCRFQKWFIKPTKQNKNTKKYHTVVHSKCCKIYYHKNDIQLFISAKLLPCLAPY